MRALIQLASCGEQHAATVLFERFHDRLLRMVRLRMDQRLRGRVDSEDILQDAYLDASQRLKGYAARPAMSFFLWLRFLVAQKLIDAQRHHLGVEKRDATRDVSLYRGPMPEASSACLAARLLGRLTSPSSAAIRAETQIKVQEVLERRRRGELPSLKEYTDRYPDLADEIRDVFPALVMMDEIDPLSAELGRSLGSVLGQHGPASPHQVGDFRILREIGQGGMGVVYEAQQESLGRRVALKVLPAGFAQRGRYRERFQREARAAARLHHTNIVPVFGVGTDGDVLYYAMQFIQGQGLDAVLEDVRAMRGQAAVLDAALQPTQSLGSAEAARCLLTGQFHPAAPATDTGSSAPPAPVAGDASTAGNRSELSSQPEARYYRSIALLGVQATEGLAHAHALGILHRDIKPSNLLLDVQGTLWITDFGLARTEDSDDLTQSGEFIGTLRYMAPERFEGKNDARGDIYALGVTLYEMLTLRPPFLGSDRLSLMAQITSDEPPPPSQLAPHLPRDLETIVQKAMARDPAARYGTARELADDLRRFLENRPIKARRSSTTERVWRWCRRNPTVAALLSAVFLLLSCLTVGSLFAAFRLNVERRAATAAEADRTEKLYESLVAQANASRFSHRVGQRFDTLAAVGKAAELVRERHMPPERLDRLRTLAISALLLPDFRTVRSWPGLTDSWQSWGVNDQLHWYVRSEQNQLSLCRKDTGDKIAGLGAFPAGSSVLFSPGGRFLHIWTPGPRTVWDLSVTPPRKILQSPLLGCAFHPDGRHLLVLDRDGLFRLHDLQLPERPPAPLGKQRVQAQALWYAPRGEQFAVLTAGKVQVREIRTAELLFTLPEENASHVAWHPGGNYLAVVCSQHDIHVWDLRNKLTQVADLKGCRNGGMHLAFTPDGERLLSAGYEGRIRVWDWRSQRELLQLAGGSNLQMRSDGHLLVQHGTQLSEVELATGREYRAIVQQSKVGKELSYWIPEIHPHGRLLAVPMSDGTRLFDLDSGDELALLPSNHLTLAFDSHGALYTNGKEGLLRWPIQPQSDPSHLQVGPPELLHSTYLHDLACDKQGDIVAQATGNGAALVRRGKATLHVGPHADARHVRVSPEGKYVVTGNHAGDSGVKVWDTATGSLLVQLPLGNSSGGMFSPDGKWFYATGTRGNCRLEVGTWKQHPADNWQGVVTFSPDGAIVVTKVEDDMMLFQDRVTGRELLRLENPEEPSFDIRFTPDGNKLVTSSDFTHSIHIWDLWLIRGQLKDMGLEWDQPAYAAAAGSGSPLWLDVHLGNLRGPQRQGLYPWLAAFSLQAASAPYHPEPYHQRGHVYEALGQFDKAVADYTEALRWHPVDRPRQAHLYFSRANALGQLHRDADAVADFNKALELEPNNPQLLNNLAQVYLNGPAELRNPAKALSLAGRGLALAPSDPYCRNSVGIAHYRLGQYEAAIVALERSLRESKGERAAFQLYFLAMCYRRLGDLAKARECYDEAVRWEPERAERLPPNWMERLREIRQEADGLMKGKTAAR
jgi:RNA polymerase sigma-70 factor (subfamily 1)